ncbi:MAG: sugar ABC transporter ATP-binding protein [Propionibacteriaceae bacterium]|nr:sugar ABC transporter ATP-binding protein [Propionibacteriaceae bacterium]
MTNSQDVGLAGSQGGESGLLLAMSDMFKAFGETKALNGVDISIATGEIHALAGENGSGKTTLIKGAAGVVKPDSGRIVWKGGNISVANPIAAQKLGISTVFQETLFAAEQSVIDNVYMGMDGILLRKHGKTAELAGTKEILAKLGAEYIDVHAPLWALTLAERQLVTIARAVVRPWSLLILDEGTSALDSNQRDRLFDYLRASRNEGKSVLFTSHRMDEIEVLADTVTVLREGKTVLHDETKSLSPNIILAAMAGRDISTADDARPQREPKSAKLGKPALSAQRPSSDPSQTAETLTIHEGEIFGLAGLEGQGQNEFLKSLAGLVKGRAGQVVAHGEDGQDTEVKSFDQARKLKIAYVPQDRKQEGLFFSRSTLDNFSLGMLPDIVKLGFVSAKNLRKRFDEYVPVVKLLAHNPNNLIGTLSGGNQQKVLLARWLATEPKVLLLSDPMRGVDANTKAELHTLLRRLAEQGLAIVLLSTEVMELLALCDRIAVFHEGNVECVLDGTSATNTDIVAAMFGHANEMEGAAK